MTHLWTRVTNHTSWERLIQNQRSHYHLGHWRLVYFSLKGSCTFYYFGFGNLLFVRVEPETSFSLHSLSGLEKQHAWTQDFISFWFEDNRWYPFYCTHSLILLFFNRSLEGSMMCRIWCNPSASIGNVFLSSGWTVVNSSVSFELVIHFFRLIVLGGRKKEVGLFRLNLSHALFLTNIISMRFLKRREKLLLTRLIYLKIYFNIYLSTKPLFPSLWKIDSYVLSLFWIHIN